MRSRFSIGEADCLVHLTRTAGGYRLHVDDDPPVEASLQRQDGGRCIASLGGTQKRVVVAVAGDDTHVHLDGRTYLVRYHDPIRSLAGEGAGSAGGVATAPMPGTTIAVLVSPGDEVAAGAGLVVIESMKLETTIRAPRAGRVETVHVRAGESFDRDRILVTLAEAS